MDPFTKRHHVLSLVGKAHVSNDINNGSFSSCVPVSRDAEYQDPGAKAAKLAFNKFTSARGSYKSDLSFYGFMWNKPARSTNRSTNTQINITSFTLKM